MHLRNVEMFCDAIEMRSVSRAAEHHKVSQSAVSQAIQQLEKKLGMQLIDRSKRPFEMTTAGEIYFNGCRSLLQSYRDVEDRVRQLGNKVVGRVRVAAIYSVGLSQINETIEQFQKKYPDVDISLDFLHPEEVYRRLELEQDDLGLVSFPKSKGLFESRHWQDQPMVIVVGPNHDWFERDSITPELLNGSRFINFQANLDIRKATEKWFREQGVAVETIHEFDNIEYIKRDVESSTGIALLPEPTVRDECQRGRIQALQIEGVNWVRPLSVIHRKGRELSLPARKFIETLMDESPVEMSIAS